MTLTEEDYGREPFVLVELVQPRCSLRFGVAPCTAVGTPKCYQTWGSCKDRSNILPDAEFVWRFIRPQAGIMPLYEESGDNIKTNPYPMLVSVSTTSSELNVGAQRDGQSPLGVRSTCSVTFQDMPWDDHVGDFYLADRASVQNTFWRKWKARNVFYTGMMLRIYEGYRGQALAEMQRRDYIVEEMSSFDSNGRVTITGSDPLRLAQLRDAQFPRPTDTRLLTSINASQTTISITAFVPEDLTDDFGNTTLKYIRFDNEIVSYTAATLVSGTTYTLENVARGRLGTVAAEHSAEAGGQRVGRFESITGWGAAAYLIDDHTKIPPGYRIAANWNEEGFDYLITQKADRTVVSPLGVEDLLGELCQQFNFSIWWDERDREIKLLANRPPKETPIVVSDRLDILENTATVTEKRDQLITRVAVYYAPRSPFDLNKPENYKNLELNIDGFIEDSRASNTIKTLTVFANWISRDGDAIRLGARLLLRYKLPTMYTAFSLDAKFRALRVGSVIQVAHSGIVDVEGNPVMSRWQAIKAEEPKSSHSVRLELQNFSFVGRYGFIMAETATQDYLLATDLEKERGCYLADSVTELMSNGDPPYLIQ